MLYGICSAVVDVTIHDFLGTYDKLYLDLIARIRSEEYRALRENVITYGDIQNLQGKSIWECLYRIRTMCGAGRTWTVQVKRAVLVVDGKSEDLLKAKKVHIDDFQPMEFKLINMIMYTYIYKEEGAC